MHWPDARSGEGQQPSSPIRRERTACRRSYPIGQQLHAPRWPRCALSAARKPFRYSPRIEHYTEAESHLGAAIASLEAAAALSGQFASSVADVQIASTLPDNLPAPRFQRSIVRGRCHATETLSIASAVIET